MRTCRRRASIEFFRGELNFLFICSPLPRSEQTCNLPWNLVSGIFARSKRAPRSLRNSSRFNVVALFASMALLECVSHLLPIAPLLPFCCSFRLQSTVLRELAYCRSVHAALPLFHLTLR